MNARQHDTKYAACDVLHTVLHSNGSPYLVMINETIKKT